MVQLIKIALRDLGRNKRRSFFSALALGMGLALLLLLASFVNGEMNSAIDSTILLQSGHLQVRMQTYDETKSSLKWVDLLENPEKIAQQITSIPHVLIATPRLYASGMVASGDVSTGIRIIGIDPDSKANDPYRAGVLDGEFIKADDREGILVGQPLAKKLAVKIGDQLMLSVNTSNGDVAEQLFTIRGIYSTETYGFDSVTVFMPLIKTQSIVQAEKHASTIFILLKDKTMAEAVSAALKGSNYSVLTWQEMNQMILETEKMANGYMFFLYLIVLAITSTVIMNTLIMAVFERTREIGILSSLGMKSFRIMLMFLAESSLIGVGGILMGLVLGMLIVGYFSTFGFYIGNLGMTGMLISNTIYAKLTLADTISLSITAYIITILSGLYPAVMASRMEPVEALHGGK